MTKFPDFGIPYGVFADYSTSFPLAAEQGYVSTNDEDNNNANSYSANPDWTYDAQRIISSGSNTRLGMARVIVQTGTPGTWTPWLDRDNQSGNGDYEGCLS